MHKTTFSTLLAASTLLTVSAISTQAEAVDGLSANVSVANSYIWRGISQSDGEAAVSGGLDYAADSGFYVGTWTSNVDFGDETNYELDFYMGFGGELGNGFTYGAGYIYYAYPDAGYNGIDADYDFSEVFGSLGYGAFSVTAYFGVHNGDDAKWNDGAMYLSGDAEFEVADGLALSLHLGSYTYDDSSADYLDYSVTLSKSNFSFGLVATDIDGNDDIKALISYTVDIDL